ncbi:centrosomal protein CEP57L1 isoform X1 [Hyla sarda]|uniref:centrosomal protein CEP57L1 isoform X1 n=1 Tax=Hyla sarda TaxID=327740 RepID=UPI0024C261BD|nr:centrosomal protein CEP57L1 isoform X1 [Hyla sarda]XP_056422249.1 centrosomal protein CEP57L1 isoform X1 [Hyla sarda]XP_056422250.1 centrosomal protein CEP57L1 isoform X1 [Hyla sarda]XP_056422251.1 centrosomal protein CEP57L1 isoform X1 [Hyla sarda]
MDSLLKDSYLATFCSPPNSVPIADLLESKSSSSRKLICTIKPNSPHSYDILEAPNSTALVSALKTLQEKISRLELEKSTAQNHGTSLPMETAECKKVWFSKEKTDSPQLEAGRQKSDVISQLNAAEERCSLLEKQLNYMRKMVLHAEVDKNTIMDQQTFLKRDNIQDKLEKLELLEKECFRLTATQQIAESKIHQLEEKLHAEEQHRKLMHEKVLQLETGPEVNTILSSASAENAFQRKVKEKKPYQVRKCSTCLIFWWCCQIHLYMVDYGIHWKKPAASKSSTSEQKASVKAGDLPFVAGKSTSTSHSLSANVQSVLHMMKHRSQSPAVAQQRSRSAGHKPCSRSLGVNRTSATYTACSSGDSLTDLLLDLQGELEEMSFDHQELLKQINDTKDNDLREDLERELDCLVKQMETKSDQILKLRRHQENVIRLKKAARSMKKLSSNARRALAGEPCRADKPATPRRKEIPATPMKKGETLPRSTPTPNGKASLQLLKNVQKIQMTLKKDDIMWEK